MLFSHHSYVRLLGSSADNMPSFRACSQLLSSVSGYQYSRKAWRKEGLELLLDPNFFMMDPRSLVSWKVVVDNLLTHDRTTFKDLMSLPLGACTRLVRDRFLMLHHHLEQSPLQS